MADDRRSAVAPAPLLWLSPERVAKELERSAERQELERAWRRSRTRMGLECGALVLLGYAGYGIAFHVTDPDAVAIAESAAFLVGYGAPFLRWLVWYLRQAE